MVLKKILAEEKYTFSIAKLALIVQSFLTTVIITLLLFEVANIRYPEYMLVAALFIDILFICFHISYRLLYKGPKVHLSRLEKNILMGHIVASLIALFSTGYMVFKGIDVAYEWMCLVLSSWITSLVFGIIFFVKKYKYKLFL